MRESNQRWKSNNKKAIKKATINIMKKVHLTLEWKVPSSLQGRKKNYTFWIWCLEPKTKLGTFEIYLSGCNLKVGSSHESIFKSQSRNSCSCPNTYSSNGVRDQIDLEEITFQRNIYWWHWGSIYHQFKQFLGHSMLHFY